MLKRIFCFAVLAAVIASGIYGAINRKTYTDLASSEDFYDQVYVAQLPEDLAQKVCEKELITLSELPIILRVEPAEEIHHTFAADSIKVVVKEVFKGDDVRKGDVILITGDGWATDFGSEPRTMECYFSNIMKPGNEYLVFIKGSSVSLYGEQFYKLYIHEYMVSIAGVFSYSDTDDIVSINHFRESTYVPYREVKDNGFFADTEIALTAMKQLRNEMIERYPEGSGK